MAIIQVINNYHNLKFTIKLMLTQVLSFYESICYGFYIKLNTNIKATYIKSKLQLKIENN